MNFDSFISETQPTAPCALLMADRGMILRAMHYSNTHVLHALQIIGEAESKITAETRQQSPEIQWKQLIGIRQRIVHDYDAVKYDVVWSTIVDDLPSLIQQLDAILPPFTEEES